MTVMVALAQSGCECGRAPLSFEAFKVCLVPDSGSPEAGEPFMVRASPGVNLDAGCTTALDGGQLVVTVTGVDVSYFPGSEAIPPDVTCSVEALPPGSYFVNETPGRISFEVPRGDGGFPVCP